jgi:hypothetical protein
MRLIEVSGARQGSYTDRSPKVVVASYGYWTGVITYNGIGAINNLSTADWLAAKLSHVPGSRSIRDVEAVIQSEAPAWVKPATDRRHTFLLAISARGQPPKLTVISNYESLHAAPTSFAANQFTITRYTAGKTVDVKCFANPQAVSSDDVATLINTIMSGADSSVTRELMAQIIETASQSKAAQNLISRASLTYFLASDGNGWGEPHNCITDKLMVRNLIMGTDTTPVVEKIFAEEKPGESPILRGWTTARGAPLVEKRRGNEFSFDSAVEVRPPSAKDVVLIIGGRSGPSMKERPQLYRSSTGEFDSADELRDPREFNVAIKLADSRVLVAGGSDTDGNSLNTAEIYDPGTGNFLRTGDMTSRRRAPMACLLCTGDVLLAGGYDRVKTTNSSEIYRTGPGLFASSGNMADPYSQCIATMLKTGEVLIAGCSDAKADGPSAEVYDVSTGLFTVINGLLHPRVNHTATLLESGEVLIAGGSFGGAYFTSGEVYDPLKRSFRSIGNMTTVRVTPSATLLLNGMVLLTGGLRYVRQPSGGSQAIFLATAELYDPRTETFTPTGDMSRARRGHTATLLRNGEVLIVGGVTTDRADPAEIYDPSTGKFYPTGALKVGRVHHTATLIGSA